MIDSINNGWQKLTGDPEAFSMENRVFIVITLLCTVLMTGITVVNFFLGFQMVAFWTFLMTAMVFALFYISRFSNKFKLASYLFISLSYIMMAGNYFLNSGSSGPSVYGFLVTFLIIITITPSRTHLLWFILHSTMAVSLFTLEATWPHLITYQYDSLEPNRMIDLTLTYVPVLLFIYTIGIFVRASYHIEKKLSNHRLETINHKKIELEHLNSEKDRLFSIIGHDLRSPLFSIQGFLEILNEPNIPENEKVEIQKQLLDLTTNTSNLLNNLLMWSSNNGKDTALEKITLQPAINEFVNLIEPQAYKKDIALHYIRIEEPISILAHKDMFQVVMRNVLGNAIKFTPPGGNIQLWCTKMDKHIEIHIQDNGIGIPKESQADVFTSKAKSTSGTQNETGIGLGLVLCHDFMKSMGGDIRFTSQQGKGSTFTLSLATVSS